MQAARHVLAARRIATFDGPHGWDHVATRLGTSTPCRSAEGTAVVCVPDVVLLFEVRVDFNLSWSSIEVFERGAPVLDTGPAEGAARELALAEDRVIHARHASFMDVLRLGRDRQLLRVGAMQFLIFGGYLALLGSLPHALIARGVPLPRVGPAIALWLVAAAFANFAGPALSDRLGRRRPLLLLGGVVAGVALLASVPPWGRPG